MNSCITDYSIAWTFCMVVSIVVGAVAGAAITHIWRRAD